MSCMDCKWAEWRRTPTGRIKRHESGRCKAPDPPAPVLPASATRAVSGFNWPPRRSAIWPEDFPGCPLYEKAEKEAVA